MESLTRTAQGTLFQSTRSHGARLIAIILLLPHESFNPRARTERDDCTGLVIARFAVSIHALARSATKFASSDNGKILVSIHALARSATMSGKSLDDWIRFQSTRSHGARLNTFIIKFNVLRFNPRARTERDGKSVEFFFAGISFNPRARTERDAGFILLCFCCQCFNPRARTERDNFSKLMCVVHRKFQSTRSHGARHTTGYNLVDAETVSIHALARSATFYKRD